MKMFLVVCGLCCLLQATAQKTIISDANAESRLVTAFNSITVSGGIDLYLLQGDEDGVAVSAAEASMTKHMLTTVSGNELTISFRAKGVRYRSSGKKMIAYISFKNLQKITASGSSDIYVNGIITGEELAIRLSGASDFKGEVHVERLVIDQSGASDVRISGKATSLQAGASGASDLKGYELVTAQCTAQASGASGIQVTVSDEMNASASGASSIYYKGDAQLKSSHTSGASNVGKKG